VGIGPGRGGVSPRLQCCLRVGTVYGCGSASEIGLEHPEPEAVLVGGQAMGASSALASATMSTCETSRTLRRYCVQGQDNNASCAIRGPFVRFFDAGFTA